MDLVDGMAVLCESGPVLGSIEYAVGPGCSIGELVVGYCYFRRSGVVLVILLAVVLLSVWLYRFVVWCVVL